MKKKNILTLLVIGTFGLYILYQNVGGGASSLVPPMVTNTQPFIPSSASQSSDGQTVSQSQSVSSNVSPGNVSSSNSTASTSQSTTSNGSTSGSSMTMMGGMGGMMAKYKDGSYTGPVVNAYYGDMQVKAVIQGGKLVDVQFLQYPNEHSTSRFINGYAMPYLKSEAIQAQSANVSTISGATDSSGAFRQSLASALSQALNG